MYRSVISTLALAAAVNAVNHRIDVGEDSAITFEPNTVTAAMGDTLSFHFYSGSGPHDVVSSSFDTPCAPNTNAFFSSLIEGDSGGTTAFVVNVTSADPIYFYCSARRHCQNGMVGVVNAPNGQGAAEYASAAQNVAAASAPASVQGGAVVTATSSDDNESSTTSTGSASSTSSSGATTTASSGSSTTSTGTGTASGSAAATTSPSSATKNSQTIVKLGLAVALGGLAVWLA